MNADYLETNDDEDDLHSALSEAATLTPIPEPVTITKQSKYKSRFFFNSKSEQVSNEEERISRFKPKTLEHVDELIVNRSSQYLKELPATLEENITAIREFFLTELSPLTLALNPGSNQASAVVNMAIGVNVEPSVILQFERMFAKGINIKMSNYIANYLNLPKEDALILLQSISPVRKEAVFVGSDPLLNGYTKPEKPEGV